MRIGPLGEAGFESFDLDVETAIRIHGVCAGSGPAVLLLHGHPQTPLTWHAVAPFAAGASLVGWRWIILTPSVASRSWISRRRRPFPQEEVAADTTAAILEFLRQGLV